MHLIWLCHYWEISFLILHHMQAAIANLTITQLHTAALHTDTVEVLL